MEVFVLTFSESHDGEIFEGVFKSIEDAVDSLDKNNTIIVERSQKYKNEYHVLEHEKTFIKHPEGNYWYENEYHHTITKHIL